MVRSLQDIRNNVMDVTVLSRCSGYARILNLFCAYIHTSRCGTRAGVNIKEVRSKRHGQNHVEWSVENN